MTSLYLAASFALSLSAVSYGDVPAAPTVVATGCIEPASAEPAATRPDTRFVLINQHVASKTAAGAPVSSTVAYRIDDADEGKVASHQGQKVELRGQLEPQTSVAPGARVPAPKVKVVSLQVLASSCSK